MEDVTVAKVTAAEPPAAADDATRLAPPPLKRDALPAGTLLLHTYKVERLLSQGGMGEVYLARHNLLGTLHAIKIIKPALTRDPMVFALYQREATVLRDIRDDAVVSYDGFFQDADGRCYLVMEFADGPSLGERLEQRPLTPAEIYLLRDRLCTGLAAAHACGVVHRDVSPDNVILPGGRIEDAKLIDFGIAKLTDQSAPTILGEVFAGKYRYASPEQLALYGGAVDARSDLYSLGLVLAAAALGKPLAMGQSYETACHARRRVPDLAGVPAELRPQLNALLQPDPARRTQSVADLLRSWPAPGRERAGASRVSGKPALIVAAGAGSLVLLLGGGVYWWLSRAPEPPIPPVQPVVVTPPQPKVETPAQTVPEPPAPAVPVDLTAVTRLPPEQVDVQATQLYQAGRLDEALVLWERIGERYAPAALQLGQLYDPVQWGTLPTPFSKPNPRKAEQWYRQAAALGAESAADHLQALEHWRLQNGDNP